MKKIFLSFLVFSALAAPGQVDDEEIIKNLEFVESLDLLQNDETPDLKSWATQEIMDDTSSESIGEET